MILARPAIPRLAIGGFFALNGQESCWRGAASGRAAAAWDHPSAVLRTPFRERCDMTDHREAEDSRDPRDPHDPTESTESADPTEPIDRTDPTEPIDRADPLEQIDSTESVDHSDHVEFDPLSFVTL